MRLEILSICLPTLSLVLMINNKNILFPFESEEMKAEHLSNLTNIK